MSSTKLDDQNIATVMGGQCPLCKVRLRAVRVKEGVYFECPFGHGEAVGFSILKKLSHNDLYQWMWSHLESVALVGANPDAGRHCPSCSQTMRVVNLHKGQSGALIDVCRSCFLVWFDKGEQEMVPKVVVAPNPLTTSGKLLIAKATLESQNNVQHSKDLGVTELSLPEALGESPSLAKRAALVLGLPIKLDEEEYSRAPVYTWMLILLITVASVGAFEDLNSAVERWGFFARDPLRNLGLNTFSSFFIHCGWMHLLGNLYFLRIFGQRAEDDLGGWRYFLLLASGIVAGSVATVIIEPPNVPMIGASGGIWALAAYDLLRYPRSRMMLFLGFRPMSGVLVIPSILFFILYLFLNLLGGIGVVTHGRVAIAYFGHLGGIGAGLLFYFLMPKVRRKF